MTSTGEELFRLERYQAAADALVAFGADGAPIGTYLSRPAASGRHRRPGRDQRPGGGPAAAATRGPATPSTWSAPAGRRWPGWICRRRTDGWVDDQWSLRPLIAGRRPPAAPLAAVALLLAAKVLLGRHRSCPRRQDDGLDWQDLLEGD